MRCYKSFDELYIDNEIATILNSDEVIHIKLSKEEINGKKKIKKDILFLLGVLFAAGKQIQVDNLNQLDLSLDKSYDKMVYYWHKNKLIPKVADKSGKYNGFLVCPVKCVAQEEVHHIIYNLENRGYKIYYPAYNTNQKDDLTGGYKICLDNVNAIANSNSMFLYYDKDSAGTMFSLGVAYLLHYINPSREFVLLNRDKVKLEYDDFSDRIVQKLLSDQAQLECIKRNNYGFRKRNLI